MTADSSPRSAGVDTVQPSLQRQSPGSEPAADVGAGILERPLASQQPPALPPRLADEDLLDRVDEIAVVTRTQDSGSVDALPPPDAADPAASSPRESFPPQVPASSNVVGLTAQQRHHQQNDVDHVAALTAAAKAVVRQTTKAAAPLILPSSAGNQQQHDDSTTAL